VLDVLRQLERVHREQPVDAAHVAGERPARELASMMAVDGLPMRGALLDPSQMGVRDGDEGRGVAQRLECRRRRTRRVMDEALRR
jgi:hypothetical protein